MSMGRMPKRSVPDFLLWLVVFAMLTVCAVFAGIGFPPDAWYASIEKPAWTPPSYVFPIVWTTLYVFIAVAGAMVWTAFENKAIPICLWFIQLVLNGAWTWLFFGEHRIALALLDLGLLVVTVAAFVYFAWRCSKLASVLFVPYLVWICIAFALNASVWILNGWPVGPYIPGN